MVVTTEYDASRHTRTHTVTGPLSVREAIRVLDEVYSAPDFRADALALWDFREAEMDWTPEEIRRLLSDAKSRQKKRGETYVAIVVSRDVDFGIARSLEMWGEWKPGAMRAFRDMDEASAWLEEQR